MKQFVISGPTGSGKTDFAFQLAKKFSWPLANADSYQFYKEIPVLSNQPHFEMKFLADRSLAEPISSGEFGRLSKSLFDQSYLWVGTGLYMGAVLYGLDPERKKGTPFQSEPRVDYKMIVLDPPRAKLYENLNSRVDEMLARSALEEAAHIKSLVDRSVLAQNNPVLKAIGLSHLLRHLNAELDFDRAVELWKRDTRRLAKRQWTWLRKFCPPSSRVLWINPEKVGFLSQDLLSFFESD